MSHDGAAASAYTIARYELAFSGYSGAGKTSLIAALIRHLAPAYRIAYVKHDAHRFTMDREGKDTFRATDAGARTVLINDEERFACLGTGTIEPRLAALLLQDADFVFLEGYRHTDVPKIVVVDRAGAILGELEDGGITNVVAFALHQDAAPDVLERVRALAPALPVFSAADIAGIAAEVMAHFARRSAAIPLYGVVLGGGKSTRMGIDKAGIEYHGVAQVRWAAQLLSRVCSKVFVSTRSEQANDPVFAGFEQIHDRFLDIGPLGGILSALHAYPQAAWLVLGCDLPFVTIETLNELLRKRDPFRLATCYDAADDGMPEPLCAIYEPSYRARVHQLLSEGRTCPRKSLLLSRCLRIPLADPEALVNVNSPEESEAARTRLGGERA